MQTLIEVLTKVNPNNLLTHRLPLFNLNKNAYRDSITKSSVYAKVCILKKSNITTSKNSSLFKMISHQDVESHSSASSSGKFFSNYKVRLIADYKWLISILLNCFDKFLAFAKAFAL